VSTSSLIIFLRLIKRFWSGDGEGSLEAEQGVAEGVSMLNRICNIDGGPEGGPDESVVPGCRIDSLLPLVGPLGG